LPDGVANLSATERFDPEDGLKIERESYENIAHTQNLATLAIIIAIGAARLQASDHIDSPTIAQKAE